MSFFLTVLATVLALTGWLVALFVTTFPSVVAIPIETARADVITDCVAAVTIAFIARLWESR